MIEVGLSIRGISEIDQGMPPSLAFIYMRTLFIIDLRFFPLEIVEDRMTWQGTGIFWNKYCFKSL